MDFGPCGYHARGAPCYRRVMAGLPSMKFISITANGVVSLGEKLHSSDEVVVLISGGFGGGTLTFGYMDDTETFIAFVATEAAFTAADEFAVMMGAGQVLAANLTGATGPTIKVGVAASYFSA